ncbi:HEAT repeat domain-containing protein [Streptomyces sp. L7]
MDERLPQGSRRSWRSSANCRAGHAPWGRRRTASGSARPCPSPGPADFEREQHGIRPPESYRGFLTTIGHAGAGPHHGLAPLDDWDRLVLGRIPPGHLATPFPLSLHRPPRTRTGTGCRATTTPSPTPALIMLTGSGCSLYTALVVSGPARGRVVNVCVELRPPDFCHDTGFLAWYERWPDETLDGMDTSGFDRSLPFDQPALVSVLRDAPDPGGGMRSPPGHWAATRGPYPPSDPALRGRRRRRRGRRGARGGRHRARPSPGPTPTSPRSSGPCRTPTPLPVASRSPCCPAGAPPGTPGPAPCSPTPSPEVRHTAARVLDDSGVLTEQDLAPLLADPDRSVRSMAAWRLESL